MNWIKRAWRGEEKLWKVFWLYGLLGGIILQIVLAVFVPVLNMIAIMDGKSSLLSMLVTIPILLAYSIWLLVSEWRCAFNVDWRGWGYIVRVLVALAAITIPFSIVAGGMAGKKIGGMASTITMECMKDLESKGVDSTSEAYKTQLSECADTRMKLYMQQTKQQP